MHPIEGVLAASFGDTLAPWLPFVAVIVGGVMYYFAPGRKIREAAVKNTADVLEQQNRALEQKIHSQELELTDLRAKFSEQEKAIAFLRTLAMPQEALQGIVTSTVRELTAALMTGIGAVAQQASDGGVNRVLEELRRIERQHLTPVTTGALKAIYEAEMRPTPPAGGSDPGGSQ